jgi:hypothetical protein
MRLSPSVQIQAISSRLVKKLAQPRSLQLTLTLRIAAIITAGLSAVTLWTCWKTQDILTASHKQTLQEATTRRRHPVSRNVFPGGKHSKSSQKPRGE